MIKEEQKLCFMTFDFVLDEIRNGNETLAYIKVAANIKGCV